MKFTTWCMRTRRGACYAPQTLQLDLWGEEPPGEGVVGNGRERSGGEGWDGKMKGEINLEEGGKGKEGRKINGSGGEGRENRERGFIPALLYPTSSRAEGH